MEISKIEMPHIGAMLRKHAKENRVFQAAWARHQGIKPKTVTSYYKRKSIQIATLFAISKVLKYNFIREIADQLPAEFPPHASNPLDARVAELEKENEKLKLLVETWKEAAGMKRQE